ncbi:MAG: hypothetical protein HZA03_07735 [Nitrospinae bacterium]|nr:hypothetical protein [Nitrospinota bacterium]
MQTMRVREVVFIFAALMLAACGNANTANNSTAGPSVYDAPLGSNAVLLNDTGMNPRAGIDPAAPVAGGCLVRFTNISGNDINCSNAGLYANQTACQLNPYYGYANFLVQSCPTGNLIGRCVYPGHTMYYYAGYQIISPNTPVSALVTGCAASGGAWL